MRLEDKAWTRKTGHDLVGEKVSAAYLLDKNSTRVDANVTAVEAVEVDAGGGPVKPVIALITVAEIGVSCGERPVDPHLSMEDRRKSKNEQTAEHADFHRHETPLPTGVESIS
jgi:hypothetical protein